MPKSTCYSVIGHVPVDTLPALHCERLHGGCSLAIANATLFNPCPSSPFHLVSFTRRTITSCQTKNNRRPIGSARMKGPAHLLTRMIPAIDLTDSLSGVPACQLSSFTTVMPFFTTTTVMETLPPRNPPPATPSTPLHRFPSPSPRSSMPRSSTKAWQTGPRQSGTPCPISTAPRQRSQ